jgi:hypothetical protein
MLAAETASIYRYLSTVQPPWGARTCVSRGGSGHARLRVQPPCRHSAGDFVADPRSADGEYPTWRPPLDPFRSFRLAYEIEASATLTYASTFVCRRAKSGSSSSSQNFSQRSNPPICIAKSRASWRSITTSKAERSISSGVRSSSNTLPSR